MNRLTVAICTLFFGSFLMFIAFATESENQFDLHSGAEPVATVCPFPCSPTVSCSPVADCPMIPLMSGSKLFKGVEPIQGEFIVIFKEKGCSGNCVTVETELKRNAVDIEVSTSGKVEYIYTRITQGFVIKGITKEQAAEISNRKDVLYVVENNKVNPHQCSLAGMTIQNTNTDPRLWGLDRIDNNRPLTGSFANSLKNKYRYQKNGSGSRLYVVDSGIRATHSEFGNRVVDGFDYYKNSNSSSTSISTQDCDGHGTKVAGIIGGSKSGVAKNTSLISIRISTIDSTTVSMGACGTYFSEGSMIAGFDAVLKKECDSNTENCNIDKKAVVNISAGVKGCSFNLDQKAKELVSKGIPVVASAGNDTGNAIHYSPGRVNEVITVGATKLNDGIRSDSNWGCPVDVFAPGDNILTADNNSDTKNLAFGQTSAAAPLVSGLIALMVQGNSYSPAFIESRIKCTSNGSSVGANNRRCLSIANRVNFNSSGAGNANVANANTTKNFLYKNSCPQANVK